MDTNELEVVALHKYPELMKECCVLINAEWPRSETARMMMLQTSCDLLPTCLILIDKNKSVLGHCKLTPIPSIPESCFVETVVISKKLRGKKLGTYLMKKAEYHCKDVLKLKMVHLSTKGQEDFYSKLGYKICPPVTIYGGYRVMNFVSSSPSHKVENSMPQAVNSLKCSIKHTGPPPPPPPPMPRIQDSLSSKISTDNKTNKTYMMKHL